MQANNFMYSGIFEILTSNEDPETLFELLTLIGEGSFGSVWKVLHKSTGAIYATKIIPIDSGELENIRSEITILKECKSPYVIGYFGSYLKGSNLWIVMEYCAAGSAADIMRATKKPFNEIQIATILSLILKGLDYLHNSKKIHRDIKAGNVLLDTNGNAKLGDFGVAIHQLVTISDPCDTVTGTPFWMSPEVIAENKYGKKTDIWSLGITAIELAEMEPPYSHIHPYRAMYVIKNRPAQGLTNQDQWSAEFNKFVKRCLTINPKERPNAKELLQDEFIAKARGTGILCELVANSLDLIEEYRIENATHDNKKKRSPSFVEESIVDDYFGSENELPEDAEGPGTMVINETLNATTVVHNDDSVQDVTVIVHSEGVLNETMIRHPTIDMKGAKDEDKAMLRQQFEHLLNGEEEKTTTSKSIIPSTNSLVEQLNKTAQKPADQGAKPKQLITAKKDNLSAKQSGPNTESTNTPNSKSGNPPKEKPKGKKLEKIPPEYKGLSSVTVQNKIKVLERDLEIELMMIKQSYKERIQKLQQVHALIRAEEEEKELKKHEDSSKMHSSRQIFSDQKNPQKAKQNPNAQSGKQTSQSPRPHMHNNADEGSSRGAQRLPRQVDERAIKTPRSDHLDVGTRAHPIFSKPELSPSNIHKNDTSPNREEGNNKASGSKIAGLANKSSQPRRNEKPNNQTSTRNGIFINYGGSPSERSPEHSNTSNENSKGVNASQENKEQKYSFHFAPLLNESPAPKTASKNKTGNNSALTVTDSFHNQSTPTVSYSITNLSPKQPVKSKQQVNASYENKSEKKSSDKFRADLKTEIIGVGESQKGNSKTPMNRVIPKNEINIGSIEDYNFNASGGKVCPTQGTSKGQGYSNNVNEGMVNPVQALLRRKY